MADYIQLGMLITSIVAILVTIIFTQKSIKSSIKLTQRQINVQIFSEYSRRYNEILQYLPSYVYEGTADHDTWKNLSLYFNLCNEEYHLWKKELVDNDIWGIWIDGMRSNLKEFVFKHKWEEIKGEYDYDFCKYFQSEVIDWNEAHGSKPNCSPNIR